MCDNWKRYKDDTKKINKELTLKDYETFFSKNDYWLSDLRHIGIAGGEPFLRPDLIDLVRAIRQILPKVSVGLQTNGLFPEKISQALEEIIKFYPQITLGVSLDGVGKTHDAVRGIKGAYEQVLKTIDLAKMLGVKEITAGMTILQNNYKEIPLVEKTLKERGVPFSCFLADEGEYYNKKEKSGLDREAKKSIIASLKNYRSDYYLDNLRLQLEGKRKRELPCYSGWTSLVIDPYGEVRPCVLRFDSFGNIKEQSLGNILMGEQTRKVREQIKKCSCWSICEVTTSAVVDPWDVFKWFIFFADKSKFLKEFWSKRTRYS